MMEHQLAGTRMRFKTVAFAWLILLVMGASWGLSFSLARMIASRGVHPLGITFWEAAIVGHHDLQRKEFRLDLAIATHNDGGAAPGQSARRQIPVDSCNAWRMTTS